MCTSVLFLLILSAEPTPSVPQTPPSAMPPAKPPTPEIEPPRLWTSDSGHTITASLLGVQDGMVQLRRSDGAIRSVPVVRFSEPDRKHLSEVRRRRAARVKKDLEARRGFLAGHQKSGDQAGIDYENRAIALLVAELASLNKGNIPTPSTVPPPAPPVPTLDPMHLVVDQVGILGKNPNVRFKIAQVIDGGVLVDVFISTRTARVIANRLSWDYGTSLGPRLFFKIPTTGLVDDMPFTPSGTWRVAGTEQFETGEGPATVFRLSPEP